MKTISLVAILATILILTSCKVNEQNILTNANKTQDTNNTFFEYASYSDVDSYSDGDTVPGVYYKVYSNGKFETLKFIYKNGGGDISLVASDSLSQSTIDSLVTIIQSSNFLSYPDIIPSFLTTNYNRDSLRIIQSSRGTIKFSYSNDQTLGIQSTTTKDVQWTDGAERQYYPADFHTLRSAIFVLLSPHSSYAGRH